MFTKYNTQTIIWSSIYLQDLYYPIYICLFGYLDVTNNMLNYLHGYLVVSYGSCRKKKLESQANI